MFGHIDLHECTDIKECIMPLLIDLLHGFMDDGKSNPKRSLPDMTYALTPGCIQYTKTCMYICMLLLLLLN